MNKRKVVTAIAVALVVAVGGTASADFYQDVIDDWSPYGGGDMVTIVEGSPLTYVHDVTDDLTIPGDIINTAHLTLLAYDPFGDAGDRYTEHTYVSLDGNPWQYLGELDSGGYSPSVDIAWVQDDGLLQVQVSVFDYTGLVGDLQLDKSTLCGDFTPVPVPGAALLGILGLSAAGVKLRRRRS